MDFNFILNLLMLALVFIMAVSRIKLYVDHKNALKLNNQNNDYKKIFTGGVFVAAYLITFIVASAISAYLFLNNDKLSTGSVDISLYALLFAVLAILAIFDLLRSIIMHTTYYNDQGIFHNKTFFRFNSIKGMKLKSPGITTEITLYSGEVQTIPTKAIRQLERHIIRSNRSQKKDEEKSID